MSKYEIRKDGKTFCSWADPRCTSSAAIIKSMNAAGYRLFIDGKPARKITHTEVKTCRAL